MPNVKIVGPVSHLGSDHKISDWVESIAADPKPTDRFWFAIEPEQNAAVGGLKLTLLSGHTAHDIIGASVTVSELWVDPSYHRRGIATDLMHSALTWVRSQPDLPQTVSLGVETNNNAAVALYAKIGFVIAKRAGKAITFTSTDGQPCYVMYKRLI